MICPKCKKEKGRLLALSRDDNKTMICDECGTEQAVRIFCESNGKICDYTSMLEGIKNNMGTTR